MHYRRLTIKIPAEDFDRLNELLEWGTKAIVLGAAIKGLITKLEGPERKAIIAKSIRSTLAYEDFSEYLGNREENNNG